MTRRYVAACLAAVVAAGSMAGLAIAGTRYSADVPADPIPTYVIRAGAIRFGVGGPTLYTATDHSSVGIVSVAANAAGDLVVTTDFDSADETLISAIVEEDFQISVKRTLCGISGGGRMSTIRCTKPDGSQAKVNSSYFDISVDNVWFQTISVVTP